MSRTRLSTLDLKISNSRRKGITRVNIKSSFSFILEKFLGPSCSSDESLVTLALILKDKFDHR